MTKAFAEAFSDKLGAQQRIRGETILSSLFFLRVKVADNGLLFFLRRARINAYTRGTAPQNPSWTHNSDRAGGPWRNS